MVILLDDDDDLVEADEVFMVLFSPDNANDRFVNGSEATVTITDDESK